jgi:hypothetical protein
LIVNHKSRVDAFIGQISCGEKPINVVNSESFDSNFSVLVTFKVVASITKIAETEIKGSVRENINGREAFDKFIENEKSASKFITNSLIISSSRISNYGALTSEVRGTDESFVKYKEVCGHCSGVGKLVCKHCGGKKVIACAHCKGEGCKHCRNLGQVRCGHCDDEGMNNCPVCLNKKSVEETYRIELRIKAIYEAEFDDNTSPKVISTINSFARLDQLKSKDVVYINSSSNLIIDEDGDIKIRYFMTCPMSIINVRFADKVDEVILYGISQRIIDLSGLSEKILRFEEERLYSVISDTKVVGGSYDELIASVNDYASIAIHMKIIMARNSLIKREIRPTPRLIGEEIENVLSAEYIERFLKNVEGAISLASICVKASYLLPALAAFPFLYAVIGIWIDEPLRFVVSLLLIVAGYFYTSFVFDGIIRKNTGEAIIMMRIPTI